MTLAVSGTKARRGLVLFDYRSRSAGRVCVHSPHVFTTARWLSMYPIWAGTRRGSACPEPNPILGGLCLRMVLNKDHSGLRSLDLKRFPSGPERSRVGTLLCVTGYLRHGFLLHRRPPSGAPPPGVLSESRPQGWQPSTNNHEVTGYKPFPFTTTSKAF